MIWLAVGFLILSGASFKLFRNNMKDARGFDFDELETDSYEHDVWAEKYGWATFWQGVSVAFLISAIILGIVAI